ncbi:MAG: ribonuclease III [Rhodothermaceae bacterium]|nr:ribonuclease III [Rhodothermaceae bacterium]
MTRNLTQTFHRAVHRRKNARWIALETTLGVRIYDFTLFDKALRHPSTESEQPTGLLASYERLEFLGDAILGAVVTEYLYQEFPDRMEGFLTTLRSRIICRETCTLIARKLGLIDFLEISPHLDLQDSRKIDSALANCLESIIGAIHLDSGISASRRFIHTHVLGGVDLPKLASRDDNYKSRLQELTQAKKWDPPVYVVADENGPPNKRIFTVDVYVRGRRRGRGHARTKKKAEQGAAHRALQSLSVTTDRKMEA